MHLINIECKMADLLKKTKEDKDSALQQKAKIAWLTLGDENTKFFHRSINHRHSSNTINVLHMGNDIISDQTRIKEIFQKYYIDLLCNDTEDRCLINVKVVQKGLVLSAAHQNLLSLSFSEEEIKKTLWSIPENKAPGLDEFNSGFYKASWPVVDPNVVSAIQDFFDSRSLPKAWNVTAITLIPKTQCPKGPRDYRPISCCNVIYKCISKLICSRLKLVLGSIISTNQGAFVVGRSILHNILLCQDVVKHYGRKNCMLSCLLKMGPRKAYDTLNWDFLKDMMIVLNFPAHFVKRILTCITSTVPPNTP